MIVQGQQERQTAQSRGQGQRRLKEIKKVLEELSRNKVMVIDESRIALHLSLIKDHPNFDENCTIS